MAVAVSTAASAVGCCGLAVAEGVVEDPASGVLQPLASRVTRASKRAARAIPHSPTICFSLRSGRLGPSPMTMTAPSSSTTTLGAGLAAICGLTGSAVGPLRCSLVIEAIQEILGQPRYQFPSGPD